MGSLRDWKEGSQVYEATLRPEKRAVRDKGGSRRVREETTRSAPYWVVAILSALPGLLATEKITEWVAIFARSTLTRETVSLVLRALASYLLGFFEWLLVCSVVGRESGDSGGATEEVGGQAVA